MPNNNRESIYFNFTYLALKLLGKGLYSNTWAAISELVANSIDASATSVYILVDLRDKDNPTMELLDNGVGMNYDDLSSKYVLIGRNKRNDINEVSKSNYMGRKGIGKLATLYLSNDYYIFSKKDGLVESWNLNVDKIGDDEYPRMRKADFGSANLICRDLFNSFQTGTYIKLNHVNLANFGERKTAALKTRLSNFFSLDDIATSIYFCLLDDNNSELSFSKIEKRIAFKNLCAYFANGVDISSEVSESVYFDTKTNIKEIKEQKFSVSRLQDFDNLSGTVEELVDGVLVKKNYELTGWIGIHATIKSNAALKNDSTFIRNSTYTPNRLRLYVRNKLADENILSVIHNTQAFSNYIEGEIHFDILDDDDFEDISTSNRQGYIETSARFQKLLNVVNPIVDALITARLKYANIINQEIKDYEEAQVAAKEERIKLLSEAYERANNAVNDISNKLNLEKAKNKKEKEINEYLTKISRVDTKKAIDVIHSLYNRSVSIKKELSKIDFSNKDLPAKAIKVMRTVSEINFKNIFMCKTIIKNKSIVESALVSCNLVKLTKEFLRDVANKVYKNSINILIKDVVDDFIVDIKPVNFTSAVENLITNSIKAHAKNLTISFCKNGNIKKIRFFDDGVGLSESINDINDIFRFGYTTTNGSGIGLFFAKSYIEDSGGILTANVEGKVLVFTMEWD